MYESARRKKNNGQTLFLPLADFYLSCLHSPQETIICRTVNWIQSLGMTGDNNLVGIGATGKPIITRLSIAEDGCVIKSARRQLAQRRIKAPAARQWNYLSVWPPRPRWRTLPPQKGDGVHFAWRAERLSCAMVAKREFMVETFLTKRRDNASFYGVQYRWMRVWRT